MSERNLDEPHYPTYRAQLIEDALVLTYELADDESVVDALVDLRHLCDLLTLDFAALDRRARKQYLKETGVEGIAHK